MCHIQYSWQSYNSAFDDQSTRFHKYHEGTMWFPFLERIFRENKMGRILSLHLSWGDGDVWRFCLSTTFGNQTADVRHSDSISGLARVRVTELDLTIALNLPSTDGSWLGSLLISRTWTDQLLKVYFSMLTLPAPLICWSTPVPVALTLGQGPPSAISSG